jgi:hypothetical protein
MVNLASTYRNQGRWDAAEELDVQVMETRKKKLGADHPSMLTSMANLASTFWNQNRWDAAEELDLQVMETCQTGAGHPSTLTNINNPAFTWKGIGKEAEAAVSYSKSYGRMCTITATCLGHQSSTYTIILYSFSYVEGRARGCCFSSSRAWR